MSRQSLVLLVLISLTPVFSDTDFKLDPAPKNIRKILEKRTIMKLEFPIFDDASVRNDLDRAIANQTSVKSQGRRGTCSIFSATAELESLLKIRTLKDLDLSENHLEFIVMTRIKSFPSEGSDTTWNVPAFQRHGAIYETDWPYENNSWENLSDLSDEEAKKAEATCGSLTGAKKTGCLLSHLNPDDTRYDAKAKSVRAEFELEKLVHEGVYEESEIKKHLDQGHPLLLGIEFFYGAWNHRKMEEYKIGTRNMTDWENGIVSTPTEKDMKISKEHPAGHSIVVIGYDDEKRVYYFKNSWGTESFGIKSDLLGTAGTTKGYGSISFDYAHNYGEFQYVGFSTRR